MLYLNKIYVSEGIDVNKISKSKKCDICHEGFKFQANVCNACHDLLMMSLNISDVTILNIKSGDYRCIISRISKSKATNLLQNIDLNKKAEHYNK